jgi:isopenicillin-N epimerase
MNPALREPLRELFALDPTVTFLNHGSYGACPRPVLAELARWHAEMERNPVEFLGRRSGALLREARVALAAYLGAQPDDLAFMPNSTTGVNTVAQSFELQAGDEVLGTDHEYGACAAAWQFVCARRGASYRTVEIPLPFEPGEFVARVMAAVTPRTRLLFVSHVTSTTALVFPVAALCARARAAGIATLIDGAHVPGQLPLALDTLGADFYVGNGHKWLCAPKGSGFLHVRPERQADLHAGVVSWGYVPEAGSGPMGQMGHIGRSAYTGHTLLEKRLQWQGTRDIAPYLSMPAAIRFHAEHGAASWQRDCHDAACALQKRVLARNGLAPIAADASFLQMAPMPVRATDAAALRARLFDHHRIEVPVTQHAGRVFVRVSAAPYNTPADFARLDAALAEERV